MSVSLTPLFGERSVYAGKKLCTRMCSTARMAIDTTSSDLLTKGEVAARLRVSPETIKRWGRDGRLRRVALSKRCVLYTAESVEALIAGESIIDLKETS